MENEDKNAQLNALMETVLMNPEAIFQEMLELPEEVFDDISPLVLESLEKVYNDPNLQLIIAQNLNAKGVQLEDLVNSFNELLDNMEQLEGHLSVAKIDFLKRLIAITINGVSECEAVNKRTVSVAIETLSDDVKIPAYAHPGDAAVDLVSTIDIDLEPGEQALIPTGIKIALPKGYEAFVMPRSGISSKSKLRISNTPGLIDSNYRGEIKVIAENIDNPIRDITYDFLEDGSIKINSILHGSVIHIEKGMKIAQLKLNVSPVFNFVKVDKLDSDTSRGEQGFGSSGVK